MNANELMIGNWVIDTFDAKRHDTIQVSFDDFHVMWNYARSGNHPIPYKGIPITAQLLINNGFKKVDGIWSKDGWFGLFETDVNSFGVVKVSDGFYIRNITYVHQLQNLFTVLGLELKMEL